MLKNTFRHAQKILGIILCCAAVLLFLLIIAVGPPDIGNPVIITIIMVAIPGVPGILLLNSRRKAIQRDEDAFYEQAMAYHPAESEPNKPQTEDYVVVICPSCGAMNKIPKNRVSKCEFCGSPIQAK